MSGSRNNPSLLLLLSELVSDRRAPHGARGLKHELIDTLVAISSSRPTRGAWIETIL